MIVRNNGYIMLLVVVALGLLAGIAVIINREAGLLLQVDASRIKKTPARYVAEAGYNHLKWQVQTGNCTGYTDLPLTNFGNHQYSATVTPQSGSPVTISATGVLVDSSSHNLSRNNIPVYQGAQTVDIQNPSAVKDTFVDVNNPANNYGNAALLQINTGGSSGIASLVHFDLSGIPANSEILSAYMKLYLNNNGSSSTNAQISAHEFLSPWLEGSGNGTVTADGATYNTSDGVTTWVWSNSYDPTQNLDNVQVGSNIGWYSWDITAAAKSWAKGSANNGLVLMGNNNAQDIALISAEHTSNSLHPALTITYVVECGTITTTPPPTGITVTLPAVADALLYHTDTWLNFGASRLLKLGKSDKYRPVIEFDTDSVPPGSTIISATLRTYMTDIPEVNKTIEVFALVKSWDEGTGEGSHTHDGVTWTLRKPGDHWDTSGGDFDTPAVASLDISPATIDGYQDFDLTALVQEWIDEEVEGSDESLLKNKGVLFRLNSTNKNLLITSKEHENTDRHPQLVITYTPPTP